MKYLLPLLLIGSVHAAEIESVSIGTNTMLVLARLVAGWLGVEV